jgi:nitroreductase
MNTLEVIAGRRSIRKFTDEPIPDEILLKILNAARQAPSGKNRQPWHFYIVKEDRRREMVETMRSGIENRKAEGMHPGSSEHSARIMEQAPITIFVFNPQQENQPKSFIENLWNVIDIQSVGAAIQNMHLAAHDLGIGALWICDIFYAYDELCTWLGETHQMIAAVSLGFADEHPAARSRKPVEEITTWL